MEQQKPKNLIEKLKENIDDKEEQFEILSTFVRLGILVWSGAILTLAYVDIPKLPKQDLDPTFIASVFTGTLATFGVQAANKSKNDHGTHSDESVQIIRIEQAPIKITTDDR